MRRFAELDNLYSERSFAAAADAMRPRAARDWCLALTGSNSLGCFRRLTFWVEPVALPLGLPSRYEQAPRSNWPWLYAVADAVRQRRHLVVEAGTGVGKSFAYLVPVILAATNELNGFVPTGRTAVNSAEELSEDADDSSDRKRAMPRVVISTHTITLQEQLIQKDLPLLQSIMPQEFTAVLVKGRHNYLSLRRLGSGGRAAPPTCSRRPRNSTQCRAACSAGRSGPGMEASAIWNFARSPAFGIEVLEATTAIASAQLCPTFKTCFYYRARRRAQNAQVLVVNHALFFSDLALRREGASILPDYDIAIFDEAHTLEAVAGDHLGLGDRVRADRAYLLTRLYNDRTNREAAGSLSSGRRPARGDALPRPSRGILSLDRRLAWPAVGGQWPRATARDRRQHAQRRHWKNWPGW